MTTRGEINSNFYQIVNVDANGTPTSLTSAIIANSNFPNANFANYAGNVTVSAQPNITSTGTLTNLTVSGNLTSANANLTNLVATTITTTGTGGQEIDSYAMSSYNSAEYVISVKDNNANNFYAAKLLTMHDTANAYITEYSVLLSNSSVGVFSANANSTHCRLLFTPTASNTQVKGIRTNVVV